MANKVGKFMDYQSVQNVGQFKTKVSFSGIYSAISTFKCVIIKAQSTWQFLTAKISSKENFKLSKSPDFKKFGICFQVQVAKSDPLSLFNGPLAWAFKEVHFGPNWGKEE